MDQERVVDKNTLNFAVMAIESAAAEMGITPMEMYRRLKDVDLIQRLIFDCYDVMHTLSIKTVTEDVVEALKNWEKAERKEDIND